MSRGTWWWMLGTLVLCGAGLRAWHLGAQSLWLDEAQFLDAATKPTVDQLIRYLIHVDFHPPVYPLMLRYWVMLAGTGDVAVRALPALWGVLLIPVSALLAFTLTERRDIGVWTAAIVTLGGYHLYLSQEGRHYTWLAVIGTAHMVSFLRVMGHKDFRWFGLFVLTGLLGLFSHYHMMLLLMGEGLLTVICRRRYWLPMAAIAASAAVFLVVWWGPLVAQSQHRALWGEGLIDPVTGWHHLAWVVARNLGWTFLDFSTGSYLRLAGDAGLDTLDAFKAAVLVATALLALLGLFWLRRTVRDPLPAWRALACLGILPLAGAIASGFLQANVYETKYVSFVAPLWATVLGAGCCVAWSRWWGRILPVLLVSGLLVSVDRFHREALPWKEDWRQAASILEREWRLEDALLQRASYTNFSLDHYLGMRITRLGVGQEVIPDGRTAGEILRAVHRREATRLWVVLSHDEYGARLLKLLASRMREETTWKLQGIIVARFGVGQP